MASLLAAIMGLQAYTNEWAGDWQVSSEKPAWHRMEFDANGWPVSGDLYFFTSSLDRNFLFVGNAVPDRRRPDAAYWMIREDRLDLLSMLPSDYRPSPNWFARTIKGSSLATSFDPRRQYEFRVAFRGVHVRRPVLAGRGRLFRWAESYTGRRRLEVWKRGSNAPALVLEQPVWNMESLGRLSDIAHYDQAFGIMILTYYRQSDPYLEVIDVNKLEEPGSARQTLSEARP